MKGYHRRGGLPWNSRLMLAVADATLGDASLEFSVQVGSPDVLACTYYTCVNARKFYRMDTALQSSSLALNTAWMLMQIPSSASLETSVKVCSADDLP